MIKDYLRNEQHSVFERISASRKFTSGFGSGELNEHGLQLVLSRHGSGVRGAFTPSTCHEGFPGLVHGGILCSLMDEAMTWACFCHERVAFTESLSVQYLAAVRVGRPIAVTAEVQTVEERRILARAEIRDLQNASLLSTSTGVFFQVPERRRDLLIDSQAARPSVEGLAACAD